MTDAAAILRASIERLVAQGVPDADIVAALAVRSRPRGLDATEWRALIRARVVNCRLVRERRPATARENAALRQGQDAQDKADAARPARGVRVTQAGLIVGVKFKPEHEVTQEERVRHALRQLGYRRPVSFLAPLERHPRGVDFLLIAATTPRAERVAGQIALWACDGHYRSGPKANRAVQRDLEAIGVPEAWKLAKYKSGRPHAKRG